MDEQTGRLSAVFPEACMADGKLICSTRLVPATAMTKVVYCVAHNCSFSAMVRVIGATDVSFQSVNFTASTGTGVAVWGSTGVTFDGCNINNHQEGLLVGATVHPAIDSWNVSLVGSDVGYTGMSSTRLTGGNRTLLSSSGFLIEDNRLHDFGRCIYTNKVGVSANGVGVTVRKNEFRSSYHAALEFSGNDHLFELNVFHHVTSIGFDSGTIYGGRDLASRGTVIRNNLFHDLDNPSPCNAFTSCIRNAIYLDDLEGGVTIVGNIFYRVRTAIFSNQGGDFVIRNNLFLDVQVAVRQDGSEQPTGSKAAALYSELDQVPFRGSLWQAHYPELQRFKDWTVPSDPPAGCLNGPLNNLYSTNIVVQFAKPFYWGECECCGQGYFRGDRPHRRWVPGFCRTPIGPTGICGAAPNDPHLKIFSLAGPWANDSAHFDIRPSNALMPDPGFVSMQPGIDLNFTLKPSSPAFKLGWKAIPEGDIGPSVKTDDETPTPFPAIIALAADATAIERLAAAELVRLLPMISTNTTARPTVMTPALAAGKVQFAVGHGAALAAGLSAARLAVLDSDSFVISTRNLSASATATGSVAMSGCECSRRGTLYAVYELLRKLGVLFLAEDSIIPPLTRLGSEALPALEFAYQPSFEYRGVNNWAAHNSAFWTATLGLNGGFSEVKPELDPAGFYKVFNDTKFWYATSATAFRLLDDLAASHTSTNNIPPALYTAHPEWFSNSVNGSGLPRGIEGCVAHKCQLCWSEPLLLDFLVSQVTMFLSADPSIGVLTISNMDSVGKCQSKAELAIVAAEGSEGGPQMRAANYIAAVCSHTSSNDLLGENNFDARHQRLTHRLHVCRGLKNSSPTC